MGTGNGCASWVHCLSGSGYLELELELELAPRTHKREQMRRNGMWERERRLGGDFWREGELYCCEANGSSRERRNRIWGDFGEKASCVVRATNDFGGDLSRIR